jgi:hypothetical protein
VKLRCAHEIPLSADAFWDIIHSPAYEARVAEAIGLRAYRELERREEPDAIYRRIGVEAELPDALGALIRRVGLDAPAGYVEEQWRSRTRREVRWRMTPAVLADRARVEGVVKVEPRGARGCLRVLEGDVRVELFAVGRLIERAAIGIVVDAYAKAAAVAAPPRARR